jgi:hypothetical protein
VQPGGSVDAGIAVQFLALQSLSCLWTFPGNCGVPRNGWMPATDSTISKADCTAFSRQQLPYLGPSNLCQPPGRIPDNAPASLSPGRVKVAVRVVTHGRPPQFLPDGIVRAAPAGHSGQRRNRERVCLNPKLSYFYENLRLCPFCRPRDETRVSRKRDIAQNRARHRRAPECGQVGCVLCRRLPDAHSHRRQRPKHNSQSNEAEVATFGLCERNQSSPPIKGNGSREVTDLLT